MWYGKDDDDEEPLTRQEVARLKEMAWQNKRDDQDFSRTQNHFHTNNKDR